MTQQDASHESIFEHWDQLVETYPYHQGRFLRWQARLKEFLDGIQDQVCEALQILGHFLSFTTSCLPGDGAPDCVWFAKDYGITLEAKIETRRDAISLGDVNQADRHRCSLKSSQQFNGEEVAAIIVTGMAGIDPVVENTLGNIRVIHLELVSELQSRLE